MGWGLFCNRYLNPSILLHIAAPAKKPTLNSIHRGVYLTLHTDFPAIFSVGGYSLHFLPF
ncbi:hypothetical protein CN439_13850 [Bacillus cereus]|nr:hypothetical protein CN439_13850 [Bacillus cereus]